MIEFIKILILFLIFISIISLFFPLIFEISLNSQKDIKFDRKESLQRKIRDLELDRDTGKITQEEWEKLTGEIYKKMKSEENEKI